MKRNTHQVSQARRMWDERAAGYDRYYETFEGALEHQVDWELLKGFLPQNRDAEILDAAGGTGRVTLPLAKLGYSVTLCDLSPGMLAVAREKLRRAGVLDKVALTECNVARLRFEDERFDFVLCWNGMSGAEHELIRVTKRGGRISLLLMNRCRCAIDRFAEDPAAALTLLGSPSPSVLHHGLKHRAVTPDEATRVFEAGGIKVLGIYGVCGWTNVLPISKGVLQSRTWDEKLFRQATQVLLRLSKEPSVKGIFRHLAVYGEKASMQSAN